MIPVFQTRFGGKDVPVEERGNCFQAAVASILELPLDVVPNIQEYDDNLDWYDIFSKWLEKFGFGFLCFPAGGSGIIQGYHLIGCKSTTLGEGECHTLVGFNQEVAHDPNPNAKTVGKVEDYIVFTALNPAVKGDR